MYYVVQLYSISKDAKNLSSQELYFNWGDGGHDNRNNPIGSSAFNSLEEANSLVTYLNNNVVNELTDGTIGFAVYDSKTPLYNISGLNYLGSQVSGSYLERVPIEVARALCNYWNNNHYLGRGQDDSEIVVLTYFLPSTTLEI